MSESTDDSKMEPRPVKIKSRPYRRVPYHPARKSRKLQWAVPLSDGFFTCGRCKALYRSRLRLHLHKKEKCYNELWLEDQRFKQTIKNGLQPIKMIINQLMG